MLPQLASMSAYITAASTQCNQDPLQIMRKSFFNTCVCALQTDDVAVRPIVETLDKEVETQVLTHKVSRDGSTVYMVLEEMERENNATKLRLEAEEKRVRELEDKLYTVQQELEAVGSKGGAGGGGLDLGVDAASASAGSTSDDPLQRKLEEFKNLV